MLLSAVGLARLSQDLASEASPAGLDALRPRQERRELGAYFTPEALVDFAVEQLLRAWLAGRELRWDPSGAPRIRVLDPSAGDGRFLLAMARALARLDPERAELEAIKENCLVAIERDPQYARALGERLGAAEIHCEEALLSGVVDDESVDLVIGNPPYLRSIQLGRSDEELRSRLRNRYLATSHGEWDLYAAFLEQSLRWLRPGGELALVLPSRWWTARWATPLRQELCANASIRALVDFGATQVFASATVYASLCFASSSPCAKVELARQYRGQWRVESLTSAELGGAAPWRLATGPVGKLLARLCEQGPALGECAKIVKGAGTNADAVYVIPSSDLGIEEELLHPLLRGRDVQSLGATPEWPRVLVPYDREGKLYPPEVMRLRFPVAMEHLLRHRERLETRERGRFAGDTFYCYGRPQNMRFLGLPEDKLVVPDVAKAGRAMIDSKAAMVLDSAYALRVLPGCELRLETICGVLNSKIVRLWLDQNGLPLRGGYTRMKTAYLRGLPMPAAGKARLAVAEGVRAGASHAAIDALVRRAYGVSEEEWSL